MTEQPGAASTGRVLVVVDSAAEAESAIQAAARLAADLSAELSGLFVENADLIRLADLPFAAEIATSPPMLRRLDRELLQRTLRAQAEQARRTLAEAASSLRVQWSFQVARGHSTEIALTAAGQLDLLMIRLAGRQPRRPIGAPQRALGVTMVVLDATPSAERTLETALSAASGGRLVVLFAAASRGAATIRERLAELLARVAPKAILQERPARDVNDLLQAADQGRVGLLVISRANLLLTETNVRLLAANLDCPLLLVG
ncbi:MAG TPA: hypothetical protein VG826_35775 [Pirellulales bacterium]|nr:hypothetical protein [Pirellulales bacterium]